MRECEAGPAAKLVLDAVAQMAQRQPGATAIVSPTESVSYAGLVGRGDGFAAALAKAGVGAGALVAIALERSIDRIVAQFAAWRLSAAFLPLDPASPDARLAALLADAGCAALLAEPERGARIAGKVALVSPARIPHAAALPEAETSADDLAYAIYTSGSTGKPKAVEITQGNLSALVEWHRRAFALAPGTRTSHIAGLGFDAAIWEVWPTLAAGGTLVLADEQTRLDPARLRDWLLAARIEVAFAPTALAEPMLALPWPMDASLRLLLTGADRLTRRPPAGLPFALVNNYGPTESTVVATSGLVAPDGEGLPSIGRPITGTTVHLLDADGQPVAPGATGEIWIGGEQLARGYRHDPALTAQRFCEFPGLGRLYRSGDLGRWGKDGALEFHGRGDDQIKLRGHRIEPGEIVAALNRVPGIATSAVALRDGELAAYIVAADAAPPEHATIRDHLAAHLPEYMIPTRLAQLCALPLTANGKLDRAALPDPAAAPLAAAPPGRAPATPTEERLLAIVREVIGREDIGVADDFFLAGGHSLLGTQVVIRARDAFGVELTLFHLFEQRTVAGLATTIEALVNAALDALGDDEIRRLAAG